MNLGTKRNGDSSPHYRGPKRSMRKDAWIRPWPTVITDIFKTKLKVKRHGLTRFTDISPNLTFDSLMTEKLFGLDDTGTNANVQAYEQDPAWALKTQAVERNILE